MYLSIELRLLASNIWASGELWVSRPSSRMRENAGHLPMKWSTVSASMLHLGHKLVGDRLILWR